RSDGHTHRENLRTGARKVSTGIIRCQQRRPPRLRAISAGGLLLPAVSASLFKFYLLQKFFELASLMKFEYSPHPWTQLRDPPCQSASFRFFLLRPSPLGPIQWPTLPCGTRSRRPFFSAPASRSTSLRVISL